MGVADKLQAMFHQTFLDYGPSAGNIRLANADVRQCLSDMGTEFALADCRDVANLQVGVVCVCGDSGGPAADAYCFAFAMVVPG